MVSHDRHDEIPTPGEQRNERNSGSSASDVNEEGPAEIVQQCKQERCWVDTNLTVIAANRKGGLTDAQQREWVRSPQIRSTCDVVNKQKESLTQYNIRNLQGIQEEKRLP